MIPIMAWRNIWRSRTRSLVVIGAIAIGVWAAMFMSGFATGMIKSYISNAVEDIISHIQIHAPEFKKDYEVNYYLPGVEAVEARIREETRVKALSVRTVTNGMISSSKGARGIQIKAIDPEQEAATTGLDTKVLADGEYLSGDRRNELLLSEAIAEKLHVGLRSKVVLTFQDLSGEITAGAFRVVGLFDTGNKPFDEATLFVLRRDLNRLLTPEAPAQPPLTATTPGEPSPAPAPQDLAHEIAILLNDAQEVNAVKNTLQGAFPDLLVKTYREISPDLELYESQINTISIVYLVIIMLALIFGIVNTMLMAVLERIRELGMLMAIGMNKGRVFLMIMLETVLLGIVGGPLGLMLGLLTNAYLSTHGLDLSAYSESMKQYGLSQIVYFDLDPVVYWQVPMAVTLTATLAAIYPALKAIRLRPVEAIRKL